jgi:hypothetical protein
VLHGLEDLIEQNEPDEWESLPERVDFVTGLPRGSSAMDVEADEHVVRKAIVDSLLCMAAYIAKGLDLRSASFATKAAQAYKFINPEFDDVDESDNVVAFPLTLTSEGPA